MKKILFIVGSLRKDSFNMSLAKKVDELIAGRMETEYMTPAGIPLLNQDEEYPAPDNISVMRERVALADALWIFTPEYNHAIPGGLKNLLDWISRPVIPNDYTTPVAKGKKVVISGVGGIRKTVGAREQLKDLLSFMGLELIGDSGTGYAVQKDSFKTGIWDIDNETIDKINIQIDEILEQIC